MRRTIHQFALLMILLAVMAALVSMQGCEAIPLGMTVSAATKAAEWRQKRAQDQGEEELAHHYGQLLDCLEEWEPAND